MKAMSDVMVRHEACWASVCLKTFSRIVHILIFPPECTGRPAENVKVARSVRFFIQIDYRFMHLCCP